MSVTFVRILACLVLWGMSLDARPQTPTCSSAASNAFYTGPFLGPENRIAAQDFYRDYYCSEQFRSSRYPAGFVTIFGSSTIVENNTKGTPEVNLANNLLYADVMAFASEWTRKKSRFPIMTGAGPGLMEAGSRGAAAAGGPSIGFTSYYFQGNPANAFHRYRDTDQIVTDGLVFSSVAVRESEMFRHSAAMVIAPGGSGTAWEIFQTLETIKSQQLRGVPIYLVGNAYFFWRRFDDFLDDMHARGTIDKTVLMKNVIRVERAVDVVPLLEAALRSSAPTDR
jgi:predicted Rossmann-fold nucleotide-binding protein